MQLLCLFQQVRQERREGERKGEKERDMNVAHLCGPIMQEGHRETFIPEMGKGKVGT